MSARDEGGVNRRSWPAPSGLGAWWADVGRRDHAPKVGAPQAAAPLAAFAQLILATAALMWPALAAGRPAVFSDDAGYWWQGRMIVVRGLGLFPNAPNPPDVTLTAQLIGQRVFPDPRLFSTFAAARSATYSVFLFLTQHLGTLWLTGAVQALATAAVIHALWRVAAPRAAGWTYLALIAALAATTSLAFYASFAMPDIFAGLDVLITAALMLYWDRLPWRARLGLWSLLVLSLTFHAAYLLVTGLTLPAAAFVLWRLGASGRAMRVRLGAVCAALTAAALALTLTASGLRAMTGLSAHNPPFLTARLLADGPGRSFLRHACDHAQPFVLCRFKTRAPYDSDDLLWHTSLRQGVFMVSDFDDRLALEAEQPRFVHAVILADPLGVAASAVRDFGLQLVSFYVSDPLQDPCAMKRFWYWDRSVLPVLVVDAGRCGPGASFRPSPFILFGVHGAALMLAGYMILRLAYDRRRQRRFSPPPSATPGRGPDGLDDQGRVLAAAALAAWATIANAAVCGVLSGPFSRYEARAIWLIPMLALLAVCVRQPSLNLWPERSREHCCEPSLASVLEHSIAGPGPAR